MFERQELFQYNDNFLHQWIMAWSRMDLYYMGGVHGIYQVVGDILLPLRKKIVYKFKIDEMKFLNRILKIIITFILVDFAWIFFRAESLGQAIRIIQKIITEFDFTAFFNGSLYTAGLNQREFFVMLCALAILFCVSVLKKRMNLREWLSYKPLVFRWSIYLTMVMLIIVYGIYGNDYVQTQFIYFQF